MIYALLAVIILSGLFFTAMFSVFLMDKVLGGNDNKTLAVTGALAAILAVALYVADATFQRPF